MVHLVTSLDGAAGGPLRVVVLLAHAQLSHDDTRMVCCGGRGRRLLAFRCGFCQGEGLGQLLVGLSCQGRLVVGLVALRRIVLRAILVSQNLFPAHGFHR